MRSLAVIGAFAIGAAQDIDCSSYSYVSALHYPQGAQVIYNNNLYVAQYAGGAFNIPTRDASWLKQGECHTLPPPPPCWPSWVADVYIAAGEQVSVGNFNYVNQWYASQVDYPETSVEWGPWLAMHPCSHGGDVGTPPPVPSTLGQWTTTSVNLDGDRTTSALTIDSGTTVVATEAPGIPTTTTSRASTASPIPMTTIHTTPTPTTQTFIPAFTTTTSTTTTTTTYRIQHPRTTTMSTTTTTTTTPTHGGTEVRPDGPAGPSGECVWPAYDSTKSYPGTFEYMVSHQGGVYKPSYWCDPGAIPGTSGGGCWSKVGSCMGEAPTYILTEAEAAGQIDLNGPKYQRMLDPWNPIMPTSAELAAAAQERVAGLSETQQRVFEAMRTLSVIDVEKIKPGRAENPENVRRVERIVTEDIFEQLFPLRMNVYTYSGFLKAVGAYPKYCQTYADGRDSDKICTKLLATSIAHYAQEVGANTPSFAYRGAAHDATHINVGADKFYQPGDIVPRWAQALWYVREMGWTEDSSALSGYRQCELSGDLMWPLEYQCMEKKDYFGRGSKQLSYNYNYGMFSKTFYGDALVLLGSPNLVADSWLNFASGIWFAVTPQSPKPSMLEVLDGSWVPNDADKTAGIKAGFGATINIINGGLECRLSQPSEQAKNRVSNYQALANFLHLEIPADEQLDCTNQGDFPSNGSGAVLTYWAMDWSKRFSCNLVSYQTAHLGHLAADYEACVNYWWRARWIDRDSKKFVAEYGQLAPARPLSR